MKRILWSAALLCTVAPLAAQDPSILERTKQLQEVETRRIESEVRIAVRQLEQAQGEAVKPALEKLKSITAELDGNNTLNSGKKATLIRVLKDRIRVAESGPDSPAEIETAKKAAEAREAAKKAAEEKFAEERTKVKAGLAEIAKLKRDGKSSEADKKSQDLFTAYPDNLAMQIVVGAESIRGALKTAEEIKDQKEKASVATILDIDRSAVAPTDDITFPKDWKDRTARRKQALGVSPEERRIMMTLETPIEAKFKGSKFQDVLDTISTMTNQSMIIEKSALDEAGVTYDTPVNFNVNGRVQTRTVLRSILSQMNLTYVVRDNVFHITTPSRAKEMLTTRVYYLGDIVAGAGPLGGVPTIGAGLDMVQLGQNVNGVIEMITSSIDPQSWDRRGGLGIVGFNLPTMSLIVRQSQEVHAMIRSGLYK